MGFVRWVILESRGGCPAYLTRAYPESKSRVFPGVRGARTATRGSFCVFCPGFCAAGSIFGRYDVFGAERPTEMGVVSGF